MFTSLFVLTRIVSNPLSNVFQKKLTNAQSHPVFIILVTHILLSLAVLPVWFWLHPAGLSALFWLNMLICAVLATVGNTLIVAALRLSDISVLGPINAYKSIVSLVLGIFLLGEFPTPIGLAGILLILAGSYFIFDREPGARGKNIVMAFVQEEGIRLRFFALLASATEAIFLKKALLLSSPLITFVFWCMLGVPVAALTVMIMKKVRLGAEMVKSKLKVSTFLLLALSTGLMQLTTLLTFGSMQVGYSLALFQTSTLLSVFFGYHFFQERNIARRLLGAVIMVGGAILIISF